MRSTPLRAVAAAAVLSMGCSSIVEYEDNGWSSVTANLSGLASECGNMSFVSARPDRDSLTAGVALRGLWSAASATAAWSPAGTGSGSAVIINRPSSIVYDPDHPSTWWESGIYNGAGVYRTDDDGATFIQLGSAAHLDLVSVDLSDPARRTLLAGGHESGQKLLQSLDGGNTWVDLGPHLPATAGDTAWPLVQDAQTYLVGSNNGTSSGVFRSIDGGTNWTMVYKGAVRARPLVGSDLSLYWILDRDAGMIRSTDHGANWTAVAGPGTLSTTSGPSLVELPDGRLAAPGGGFVLISGDHGSNWGRSGSPLPYSPVGMVYSRFRKAFYVWRFDCSPAASQPVSQDAIMSLSFDWQAK